MKKKKIPLSTCGNIGRLKKKKKKKERNRGKPLYTELDVVYVKPVNKLQFNIVEVEYNKAICSYVRKQSI